jgi:hypothetical protein
MTYTHLLMGDRTWCGLTARMPLQTTHSIGITTCPRCRYEYGPNGIGPEGRAIIVEPIDDPVPPR